VKRLGKVLVWSYLPVMVALLVVFSVAAHADDIDAQIIAAQTSLTQHMTKRVTMTAQWPAFEQKKSDIEFAYAALVKQAPIVKQEAEEIGAKQRNIDAQYDSLKSAVAQLQADGARHNANSCTEKCTQNSCDGSCAWYNNEKAALEQRQANLNQQIQSVNAANQENDNQRQTVKKSAEDLQVIQDKVSADTLQWTADVKQFKADWEDNEAQITVLQNTLARLKQIKTQVDGCMRSIPTECDNPATTELVTRCEKMHAACGKMFDGN
jgi:chromosome segregation ATPase